MLEGDLVVNGEVYGVGEITSARLPVQFIIPIR